jgi:hypothetical protein
MNRPGEHLGLSDLLASVRGLSCEPIHAHSAGRPWPSGDPSRRHPLRHKHRDTRRKLSVRPLLLPSQSSHPEYLSSASPFLPLAISCEPAHKSVRIGLIPHQQQPHTVRTQSAGQDVQDVQDVPASRIVRCGGASSSGRPQPCRKRPTLRIGNRVGPSSTGDAGIDTRHTLADPAETSQGHLGTSQDIPRCLN